MSHKISSKELPKKKIQNTKEESNLRKRAIDAIFTTRMVNIGLTLLLVIVLLFGGFVIYLNTANIQVNENTPALLKKAVELNNAVFKKTALSTPVAIVNGVEISNVEFDARYNLIPVEYQQYVSKGEILSQMINETILMQEAKRLNLSATEEEVSARIDSIIAENGITVEDFQTALAKSNLTVDYARNFYKKELALSKLLKLEVFDKVVITERDIERYYDDNLDYFKIPESVNVSHILICHNESVQCISNLTKEEARKKAISVEAKINDTNFGLIAYEYSDDPAAKESFGNLNWISKDASYDQTFMNATFALQTREVSQPVETRYGYHIIKVFERKPESILNISSVSDQINQTITVEKQQEVFSTYLAQAVNKSIVLTFLKE
jgi:parvulin-like peptidyl-prolyl isomerase